MNNPLLARFTDTPVLVDGGCSARFEALLDGASRIENFDKLIGESAAANDNFWYPADDWRSFYRPYVVKDGTLLLPVKGVLLHDFPWQLGSWATGYEYIWQAFIRGLDDPEVKRIALVIESPGGMVAGNFDLVDKMYERRGEKEIRAFASEYAYSAAYSIASVASKIIVSRTGGVGSIGVVTSHVDMSARLEQLGYKVTFIFAGQHKVDGNPYEALPADVKQRIQARIDELYAVFVGTVARNRNVEEKKVIATQALTFTASAAVATGWMADEIGSLEDALVAFAGEPDHADDGEDEEMEKKHTDEDLATAREASRKEGFEAGKTEGLTQGKVEGKTDGEKAAIEAMKTLIGDNPRISAVAEAVNDGIPLATAAKMAMKIPVASPTGGDKIDNKQVFKDAMDKSGNPNIKPNADKGEKGDEGDGAEMSGKDVAALAAKHGIPGFGTKD